MAQLFDPLAQALMAQGSSPEAMQTAQLDELFRTLNSAQADEQNARPLSMPFPGMAVRDEPAGGRSPATPAASQQPSTQAPSVDSRFLEGGPQSTSTKTQDRLGPANNLQMGRTPSAAPKSGMIEPPIETPDFNPTFGERLTNFGNALTSQGSVTNFAEQGRQRNATYKALRGMGLDDTMARAAVMNPDFLQTILKSRVGTPNYTMVDSGTETLAYDPRTNTVVNRFPKNIGETERQRKLAQEQAKTEANRPANWQTGKRKLMNLSQQFNTMEGDLKEAIGMVKNQGMIPETGTIGGIRQYTPFQYDARKLSGLLDTIRANIGFDKLQAMRDASPTGGALGQVSEFENKLLQATSGMLDQWGDDKFLARNLERILESWQGLNQAYENEFKQQYNIPPEARLAPSGDYVIPDPDNPGRYLRWTPESVRGPQ